jgi:hypothetical protein
MGSKISDACIKATGAVYAWAALQFAYAGLVVIGAIIGQHWGVGGVAVCVSFAMGFDWLTMAYLGRKVTGLSWSRFAAAHTPAVLLCLLVGGAALVGAEAARAAHFGKVAVLLSAGVAVAGVGGPMAWLLPGVFLGPHGMWAFREGARLARQVARVGTRTKPMEVDTLAAVGDRGTK